MYSSENARQRKTIRPKVVGFSPARTPAARSEDGILPRSAVFRRIMIYIFPAVLLVGFFGFLENLLLYHPFRTIEATPANYGAPFEDVLFTASDGTRLHGWYTPPAGDDGPVLLWAHGNAGNLSHRAENVAAIRREIGAGVFLFDYRGYGRSQGNPGEEGLYLDGRAAYAWLREQTCVGRRRGSAGLRRAQRPRQDDLLAHGATIRRQSGKGSPPTGGGADRPGNGR